MRKGREVQYQATLSQFVNNGFTGDLTEKSKVSGTGLFYGALSTYYYKCIAYWLRCIEFSFILKISASLPAGIYMPLLCKKITRCVQ